MIKPIYLKAENYVTFKKFYLPLDSQGIVRIKGINLDSAKNESGSNGAGKTVLVEALQYILFDTTLRGTKKKDLVDNKNLFIEFSFLKGKDNFLIKKYHGHSEFKNRTFIIKNGEDITPKNGSTNYVNKKILDIINITKNEFFNNVFLSPRISSIFLDGKPKEKIDYISNIFGLGEYDNLKEIVKEKIKATETKIAVSESRFSEFKILKKKIKKYKSLKSLKSIYKNFGEEIDILSTKIKKKEKKIRGIDIELKRSIIIDRSKLLSHKLKINKKSIPSLDESLVHNRTLVLGLQKTRKKLEEIRTRLGNERQASSIRTRMNLIFCSTKTVKTLKNSVTIIDGQLENARAYTDAKYKLKSLGKKKKGSAKSLLKDIQQQVEKIAVLKAGLNSKSKSIRIYSELVTPKCPVCRQRIDKKLVKETLTTLRENKDKEEKSLKKYEKAVSSLRKKHSIREEMEPLIKILSDLKDYKNLDIRDLEKKLSKTRKELDNRREYLSLSMRIKDLGIKSKTPNLKKLSLGVKKLQIQEKVFVESIQIIQELIALLKFLGNNVSEARERSFLETKKKKILNLLDKLRLEKESFLERKFLAEGKYRKVRDLHQQYVEIDNHNKKFKKTVHRLSVLKLLFEYCGYAKIMKIKELCSVLNESIAEYAAIMFTEQDLEFDINYESTGLDFVVIKKEKTYPIRLLSEGERSRLGLCFIFALRDIISNGKKIDLVVLDEIDRHLDPIGKHVFTQDLLPKLTSLYSTILIISHDESIRDSAFDKIFSVTRKNNKSRLLT